MTGSPPTDPAGEVAASERLMARVLQISGTLEHDAGDALYRVKKRGRDGFFAATVTQRGIRDRV